MRMGNMSMISVERKGMTTTATSFTNLRVLHLDRHSGAVQIDSDFGSGTGPGSRPPLAGVRTCNCLEHGQMSVPD